MLTISASVAALGVLALVALQCVVMLTSRRILYRLENDYFSPEAHAKALLRLTRFLAESDSEEATFVFDRIASRCARRETVQ